MKVTATIIRYDGNDGEVLVEFSGSGCEHGKYSMYPMDWKQLEQVYLDRSDCILELHYRDATPDEIRNVSRVKEQMRLMGLDIDQDGGKESSIE